MAASNRRSGIVYFKINGVQRDAKGSFTYNINPDKKEAIVGSDGVHGYKVMPQVNFIEGEITDASDLDLAALQALSDETITLELSNGKTIVLSNAWYAHEGTVGTEEANIPVRFEGKKGREI